MKSRLKLSEKSSAAMELCFAGALWGFGFVATIWSLRAMGPLAITGWRFAVAALIGFVIVGLRPSLRRHLSMAQFRLALTPGLLLSLTLILQTWGLRYTTATKSGFITTLYVLLVPVLERLWLKRNLPRFHFIYVTLALIGVALICDIQSSFWATFANASASSGGGAPGADHLTWNFGDLLTFICAITAAVHIIWFGRIHKRIGHAFVFNNFQSLWAAVLPLVASFALEPVPRPALADLSLAGFIMLAIGSTLVAFALQIRAQKIIAPSMVSLLFLLESPFATLFAITILGEHLRTTQWVGAGLILSAAVLCTIFSVESDSADF